MNARASEKNHPPAASKLKILLVKGHHL